ncbi:glycerophosphodiester phosphodiesterase family protein [Leeuwenhoekiella sp. A16]|uniref:glycerophosphodiester phosphodiesterase family protein n=1 Tax=unclassified Leeuwenhoekiella TaxID=2615029 RepID=UPI003A7F8AE6
MKNYILFLASLLFIGISCKPKSEQKAENMQEPTAHRIQVQGHRGERGNLPENTIPAFLSALEKGVDVLELDVVISKDKQVVVSHEPFMSSLYVQTPAGDSISKSEEKSYNLYEMDYDSIRQFDTGSKGNKNFPQQQKMKTYKPLLSEMIDSVETEIAAKGLKPVKYNIEIKSVPEEYGTYQPQPEEFVELLMQVIKEKKVENKINIQSFDTAPLNALRKNYPEIEIAYLVGNGQLEENMQALDFTPEIYSPHFGMIKDSSDVVAVHQKGMKLIPWTVNKEEDIKKMIELGVDGIITDYPERVLEKI